MPNTNFLVTGLFPRENKFSKNCDIVTIINDMLDQACFPLKNVEFIHPGEDWILPNGKLDPKLFWIDNIHLKKAGYERLAKSLRKHINLIEDKEREIKKSLCFKTLPPNSLISSNIPQSSSLSKTSSQSLEHSPIPPPSYHLSSIIYHSPHPRALKPTPKVILAPPLPPSSNITCKPSYCQTVNVINHFVRCNTVKPIHPIVTQIVKSSVIHINNVTSYKRPRIITTSENMFVSLNDENIAEDFLVNVNVTSYENSAGQQFTRICNILKLNFSFSYFTLLNFILFTFFVLHFHLSLIDSLWNIDDLIDITFFKFLRFIFNESIFLRVLKLIISFYIESLLSMQNFILKHFLKLLLTSLVASIMIPMLSKALQMFSIHYCVNFLLNRTQSFAVWLLKRKLSILEMFTYLFYSMNILISFCIMCCSLHNMFDKSVYNNTTYVINCDYSKVPISETLSWNGKVHRLSGVSFKHLTGYRENISGEMKKSFDLTKASINSVSLTGTVQQSQNNTNIKIVNLQNDLNRSIKFSHSFNKNFLENDYSIIHIILLL